MAIGWLCTTISTLQDVVIYYYMYVYTFPVHSHEYSIAVNNLFKMTDRDFKLPAVITDRVKKDNITARNHVRCVDKRNLTGIKVFRRT